MNSWDNSFELLKSIEDSNDLNKGPIGSFILKLFSKLFKKKAPKIEARLHARNILGDLPGYREKIAKEASDARTKIEKQNKLLRSAKEKHASGSMITLDELKALGEEGITSTKQSGNMQVFDVDPSGKRIGTSKKTNPDGGRKPGYEE
jgi:hypothetical protein